MGIALRDLTENTLCPLAAVVSINYDQLLTTPGTNKAVPSPEWLAEQYRRVPGLPPTLLVPPILPTGAGIKASQMVKRVVMAASGGADTVAAKAAANGVPLSNMLHPHATPTVLCYAHKKLHPTLMRDIFYYITKEVADYADPVRRHPRHTHPEDDVTSPCQSHEVRDWSYRMMGLSALWSRRHTFRCLEKGRQAPAPGYTASKSKSRHHRHHSSSKKTAEGASASSHSSSSRHRIQGDLRMPHMTFPCEACIVATIGSRAQALVDLRAGMLSRLLADQAENAMRAKRHEDKKKSSKHKNSSSRHNRNASTSTTATTASERAAGEDVGAGFGSFKPKSHPHLWPLLDVYIDAFGAEVASEIRSLSEALAKPLFFVRMCENRRRRYQHREDRHLRQSRRDRSRSHSHKHDEPNSPPFVRVKQPPRMVTKNGHRLPLPLLPPKLDPWAENYTVGSETSTEQGPSGDNYEDYADGYIDADGAFYLTSQDAEGSMPIAGNGSQIMAGTDEDGEAEYYYVASEDEDEEGDDHSAFLANERCDLAAAMQGSVPAWEDDYQRHIFDTQSVASYAAAPAMHQDQQSFVSVTVHSDPFEYDYGSFGRYGPAAHACLSTIEDDAVSLSYRSSSRAPSSYVSSTQSYQAPRSTLRPGHEPYARPANPELPSSTASRSSRSSRVSEISKSSRSKAPSSAAPSSASRRTASTATPAVSRKPVPSTSPSVSRKPVPSTSPVSRKPVPSTSASRSPVTHHEHRPTSSIYSTPNDQPWTSHRHHQAPPSSVSSTSASSSRRTGPSASASTPSSSSSTSRTTATSSSSRRARSSVTSASDASTAKAPSSNKALPHLPSSSGSSRSTRPTAPSRTQSSKQSTPSIAFAPPISRRPSAPQSYVSMQDSMARSYASSATSSRRGSSKQTDKTASTATVQAKANGARTPLSEVSASSTLSSLYSDYAGAGTPSEYTAHDPDADSVIPEDSISIILTNKCHSKEQAQWEAIQRVLASGDEALRSPEKVRWLQNLLKHVPSVRQSSTAASSAAPPPLINPSTATASTARNLNHYEPSVKRRPVGAPNSRTHEPAHQPPKPVRARHRHPSGLTDTSQSTAWPPVEWR